MNESLVKSFVASENDILFENRSGESSTTSRKQCPSRRQFSRRNDGKIRTRGYSLRPPIETRRITIKISSSDRLLRRVIKAATLRWSKIKRKYGASTKCLPAICTTLPPPPVLIKVANSDCWTIFNFLYHRHRANYLETGRPRYRRIFDFLFYLNPFEAFRQLEAGQQTVDARVLLLSLGKF